MFEIDDTGTIFIQVSRNLQQLIFDGKLKKGDKLPPERELAAQLGVSRNILREALRALSLLGLIGARQGKGNYITADFNLGLFTPLSLLFKLENGNVRDIVYMRYILDTQAIKMVAEQCDYEELHNLRSIVAQTKAPLEKSELIQLEIEFHTEICRLSKNLLMYRFMQAIYYLMREQVGVSYDHIIAKGDTLIDVIYSVHNATLKALENKDSKTAVMLTAKGYEDVFPDLDFSKIRNYE